MNLRAVPVAGPVGCSGRRARSRVGPVNVLEEGAEQHQCDFRRCGSTRIWRPPGGTLILDLFLIGSGLLITLEPMPLTAMCSF